METRDLDFSSNGKVSTWLQMARCQLAVTAGVSVLSTDAVCECGEAWVLALHLT